MNLYLITFQMADDDGIRYHTMVNAIKDYGLWARLTRATWCIKSESKTTAEIRATLIERCPLQNSERLMVVNISSSPWASYNIPTDVANWLKDDK